MSKTNFDRRDKPEELNRTEMFIDDGKFDEALQIFMIILK